MTPHEKTLNFMHLLSNFNVDKTLDELEVIFKNAANILEMDRIILYKCINKNESKVISIYSLYKDEKLIKGSVIQNKNNLNLLKAIETKKISTIPIPDIGEDIAVGIQNNKYIITGDDINEARATTKIDHLYFEFLANATENAIKMLDSKNSIKKLLIKAFTDKLTKSLNRAALDEHIDYNKDINDNVYDNKPIGVLFMDIDHFKLFNDKHGHAAGDKVLIEVFKTLKNIVGDSSIVYRYGGEEICIIVIKGNVELQAEECRKAIENLSIDWNKEKLKVTISIGISKNKEISLASKQADHALYYSKENGRNKVSLYSSKIEKWFYLRNKE